MKKLIVNANINSWSEPVSHGTIFDTSKKMQEVFAKIIKRDKNTCMGCGWKAKEFMEVSHVDNNHKNFNLENLETLCPLCHQVLHLPQVSITGGGTLIWLPEMSQNHLNKLCNGLFLIFKTKNQKWLNPANVLFTMLESRKGLLDEYVGSNDPGILAQSLINMSKEDYAKKEIFLDPIKLLAYPSRFDNVFSKWSEEFKEIENEKFFDNILPNDFFDKIKENDAFK